MMRYLIIFSIALTLPFTLSAEARTFYVNQDNGLDSNSGLSLEKPWKSIARVNSHTFSPGDEILFHRNQKWRETLAPPTSGTELNPIYFGAYGEGANPVILRTDQFSDWKLVQSDNSTSKVWKGRIPNLKNSWGITINGERLPVHKQYDKVKLNSLSNRHYYSPLNKNVFYLRNDTGNPGIAEIGARKTAIIIKNKHHILIESIDAFGPGGRATSGSSTGFMNVMIMGNSSYITLKNMTISHGNSIGVSSKFDTRNISYLNIKSHDNAGTGIYMNGLNGLIQHCRSFNNGKLITDTGDRGGIGSFKGKNIQVIENETYNNGPDDGYADFEVSMVGTGKIEIIRNYIHNCLQGCIQIAEGGDNSVISGNIINIYGTARGKMPSPGQLSGIRIGGGKQGSKNITIEDNIISNGHGSTRKYEAGIYVSWHNNSGLIVKNNIFHKNSNKTFVLRQNKDTDNVSFSGNILSAQNSRIIWNEKALSSLSQLHLMMRRNKNNQFSDEKYSSRIDRYISSRDTLNINFPDIWKHEQQPQK